MARQQSTPEQQSVRVLKVGERVRHILSELLARQEVHDDVVSAANIAVTEVRMSPDLRNATAYVKPLLGNDEDEVVTALRQNTAYLQREVAKRLGLKFAPKLKFRRLRSLPHPRFAGARRWSAPLGSAVRSAPPRGRRCRYRCRCCERSAGSENCFDSRPD